MEKKAITLGEQTLEFKASAATPHIYKHCFNKDFLLELAEYTADKTNKETVLQFYDALERLAFIMNTEATLPPEDVQDACTERNFTVWLLNLDIGSIQQDANACKKILDVWTNNQKKTSDLKNLEGRPPENLTPQSMS